jgi:hypothetical protein
MSTLTGAGPLQFDAHTRTYVLCDMPVCSGDELEIQVDESVWLLGRFEWDHRKDEFPRLFTAAITYRLTPSHILRWPAKLAAKT